MAFRLDQLLFLFGLSICWVVNSVKNSGHDILFFNLKFYNGMRDVPSDGLVSFCDIKKECFATWQKSHIQLKFNFTISSWGLQLSYVDDCVCCAICY